MNIFHCASVRTQGIVTVTTRTLEGATANFDSVIVLFKCPTSTRKVSIINVSIGECSFGTVLSQTGLSEVSVTRSQCRSTTRDSLNLMVLGVPLDYKTPIRNPALI